MDAAELRAQRELIADIQHLARVVVQGLQMADPATVWQARREQIVALRQRIRAMRQQYLRRPVF